MPSKSPTFTLRLDSEVADHYAQLAQEEGVKPGKYLSMVLTQNRHEVKVSAHLDRVEKLIDRFESRIEKFEEDNNFYNKYYEDFSGMYMMLLWLMMKEGATKDEIKMMQSKGLNYAENNFTRSEL